MSVAVHLPALGESVTEGTVTRWLKRVGDRVEIDEALVEVSTDKVDTEIPSPFAGIIEEILVAEDKSAQVGAPLVRIGAAPPADPGSIETHVPVGELRETHAPVAGPIETHAPVVDRASSASARRPGQGDGVSGGRPSSPRGPAENNSGYVTPLVRKLANQHSIDLTSLSGTGVGGRIRKQDVIDAAEAQKAPARPASGPASSLRGTVQKAPRIRQVIARRMRESLDISTQLTQVHEVDMTKVAKLRARAKNSFAAQNGVKLTYLPFIAKAVAEALKQHPKLNAAYDEDKQEITYHNAEHLAIAVDTDKGLLVPVIADAGALNLAGLAARIADVADRTRNAKIGPDELSGGTFSITNIGSVGALFDTPIINQPQVGILGTGAIVKRPIVITDDAGDDTIAIRSMMYLSLTYDHRLVDGADAGRFLQTLKARLEEGAFEADLGL